MKLVWDSLKWNEVGESKDDKKTGKDKAKTSDASPAEEADETNAAVGEVSLPESLDHRFEPRDIGALS